MAFFNFICEIDEMFSKLQCVETLNVLSQRDIPLRSDRQLD